MHLELFPLVAAMAFFIVLGAIMAAARFDTTNVLMLFALTVALYYGFRPILILSGLDSPSPDSLFDPMEVAGDVGVTLGWLTAFLVLFAVAAVAARRLSRGTGTAFFVASRPSMPRMLVVVAVLTVLSTVIAVYMVGVYGGVGSFTSAVKYDKGLAGYYFLKVPAAVGAVVAAGAFHDLRGRPAAAQHRMLLFGAALLNATYVLIWGQRSVAVVVGAILLLGSLPMSRRRQRPSRSKAVARVLLAVLLVVTASAGLRVARDTVSTGAVFEVYSNNSVWRQVSLATNSTYFDASMLAFRDWPEEYAFRDGEDFVTGAAGPVPRLLWPDKPDSVRPGQWFRQVYEPSSVNGWPVGTPTVWYLNYGPIGLMLGGLLSGALFGWLRQRQRNAVTCGLNAAMAMVVAVYVFELGWSSDTLLSVGYWLVPLWITGRVVTPRVRSTESHDPAGGPTPVQSRRPVAAAPSSVPQP